MRITVNGVEIPDTGRGVSIRVEMQGDESIGPVTLDVAGGCLYIRHDGGHSITVRGDRMPHLVLGQPPKEGNPPPLNPPGIIAIPSGNVGGG